MHQLASLLQHQLATDSSAFAHLPVIITTLKPSDLLRSAHTTKWISRINSLVASKDSASKWTGLCLAKTTADLNQEILIEQAQTWITNVVPILSRSEPFPIMQVSIQLLLSIFSSTLAMPEFQRRVTTPIVPKVTQALVSLAEKNLDVETQVLVLDGLESVIRLYPTLTKPYQASITKLALSHLSGTFPASKPFIVIQSAATLLATSHLTGGKVGGGVAWRKLLDSATGSAIEAIQIIRSTFGENQLAFQSSLSLPPYPDDPMVSIPLALDRLKCMMALINALLTSPAVRPVVVPLGSLVNLTEVLVRGAPDIEYQAPGSQGFVNPSQRALEMSLAPECILLGCDLLRSLANCVQHHLTPHVTVLLSLLCHHLTSSTHSLTIRCSLLHCVATLAQRTHAFHSSLLPSQLAKAILTSITVLLDEAPKPSVFGDTNGAGESVHKKGKKRARGYEGDEIFNSGKVVAPTLSKEGSKEVEVALDALLPLVRSGFLSPVVLSLVHRVLLSLLLTLPQRTAASISPDPLAQQKILARVSLLCSDLTTATANGWASRTLGTVISAISQPRSVGPETYSGVSIHLEHVLHPRLLPVLRSLPGVGSLVLFKKDEGQEEKDAREDLGLVNEESGEREASTREVNSLSTIPSTFSVTVTTGTGASITERLAWVPPNHPQPVQELGSAIMSSIPLNPSIPIPELLGQPSSVITNPSVPQTQIQGTLPQGTRAENLVVLSSSQFIKTNKPPEKQQSASQGTLSEMVDDHAMAVDGSVGDDEEIPTIDIDSESDVE